MDSQTIPKVLFDPDKLLISAPDFNTRSRLYRDIHTLTTPGAAQAELCSNPTSPILGDQAEPVLSNAHLFEPTPNT
jgi:hypothetical protein